MRGLYRFFILFLLICYYGFLTAGTAEKTFHESYSVLPDIRVNIENVNGNIEATSWDESKVDIRAKIRVKARSEKEAGQFLKMVTIEIDRGSDHLSVKPKWPKKENGGFFGWLMGKKPQVSVQFDIKLPKETNAKVRSVNGRLELSDINGILNLFTTNGNIEADQIQGSVNAKTVNGSIRIQFTNVPLREDVKCHTTNGSIDLILPETLQADIQMSTVNGNISTDFPLELQGYYGQKKFEGQIKGGGYLLKARTVNGSIHLHKQ